MTVSEVETAKQLTVVTVTPDSGSERALDITEISPAASTDELARGHDEAPDGGAVAWRQVFAGHLGNAVASGYPAIFGIFQLYYTSTFALPASTVSWIGSVQIFIYNCSCVVGGRLADSGYVRETVLMGSAFVALGLFLTSIATEYWQVLLAQGVCTGIGLGLIWMPCTAVVNSYFTTRRSLALALASAGSGTGSMVFPAIVQYLMPYIGFAWAVRCLGFLVLTMLVLMNLLLKPRLAKPKTMGPIIEVAAFKDMTYSLFTLGTFLVYWALYLGFFYMNTFAMTLPFHAFTTTSTTTLLLLSNGASTVSRILLGYLSDTYMGPVNGYILSVGALGLVFFTWIAVGSAIGMYLWAAAFGLASGAVQGGFVSALASLTADPQKLGIRLGMICGFLGIASLSGPPTAGAIIDMSGGWYGWAQVWGGGVEILATIVLVAARWRIGRTLWGKV